MFARHHIDYCCKGKKPLAEACLELELDLPLVVAELEIAIAHRGADPGAPDPRAMSTREVIIKLIAPHHQYLHRTLPFLKNLAAKVARVHGDRESALREVSRLVDVLAKTFEDHLIEEEAVLFPALMAGASEPVALLLREMRSEHDIVGQLLEAVRLAASDFRPPAWACTSYRTLMSELANLEADTLAHVHLENHVLLPRFLPE